MFSTREVKAWKEPPFISGFHFLFQLSDVSSPRSITSTPLSGKESVFFAEAPFKVSPFVLEFLSVVMILDGLALIYTTLCKPDCTSESLCHDSSP